MDEYTPRPEETPAPTPFAPSVVPKTISTGTYIGRFLLAGLLSVIPVLGFILLIVLACTGKDKDRKNFFKAWLIVAVILCVLAVVVTLSVLYAISGSLGVWF